MAKTEGPARISSTGLKSVLIHLPRYLWELIRDTGRDTFQQIIEARLLIYASSLAYTTILSIIPLLAVSFAVFHAFGGLNKLYSVVEPFILDNLAEGVSDEVVDKIKSFIDNVHASAIGIGGVIGLIFTSLSMLSSIETAINSVWLSSEKRTLPKRLAYYSLVIGIGPLALAFAVGVVTSTFSVENEGVLAWIANFFPLGTGIFFLLVGIFFFIYKFVPNTIVHWRYAFYSSVFAATLWDLARVAYAFYTRKAVSYNRIYGSLGAIPILMLWIYISWVIVLGGAAMNAALQKRVNRFYRHIEKDLNVDEKSS
jgi:membrane protein